MFHLQVILFTIAACLLFNCSYCENNSSANKTEEKNKSLRMTYYLVIGRVIMPDDCQYVNQLPPEKRCKWVKNATRCEHLNNSFIKYSQLIFCHFNTKTLMIVGTCLLIFWLVCLFTTLGTTSEEFFCPSLAVLANVLRLSENVAGVTILALGNGSPDLFSSIQGINENHSELVYNEIMGGGLFVSIVVVGALCIKCPFRLEGDLFLRDCIFYMVAVVWTYSSLGDGLVTLWEALVFLIIYLVYLAAVILCEFTSGTKVIRTTLKREAGEDLQEMPKALVDQLGEAEDIANESEHFLNVINSAAIVDTKKKTKTKGLVKELDNIQRREELQKSNLSKQRSRFKEAINRYSKVKLGDLSTAERAQVIGSSIRDVYSENEEEDEDETGSVPQMGLVKEFFFAINPINKEDWREMKVMYKIFACFQAPFLVLLKLVIPIVDPTAVNSAWCKSLYVFNCFIMPLYSVVVLRVAMKEVMPGVPYILIAALISISLCIFVALTSKQDPPPKYHNAFALMGFVSSIITVYVVVNEVVGVLNAIGFVLSVTDATLGITIMAWGNSIGDLATTLSLASAGLPRMAFAGCYGGPLLNILLGLGLALTIKVTTNGVRLNNYEADIDLGAFSGNIFMYLLGGLICSVVMLPAMGFEARKSFGYYLILTYFCFTLNIFLIEFDVIHPLANFYYQKAVFPNGTIANFTQL